MMREKKALVKVVAPRFQEAGVKDKEVILDEFVQATGYNRCYAAYLLRNHGKKVRVGTVIIVGDATKRLKRESRKIYDHAVLDALKQIWMIMDCICGKRLVGIIKELIPILELHGEIVLLSETRGKLLKISAATIDRLLAEEKNRLVGRGRSRTKPGTLLKSQIPIRTFSEWSEARPGFVEIDLVAHDGGSSSGEYAQTLDVTDVCTGWTEARAVRNKAQVWVFEALVQIRKQLPFELLGIDSDNGSEFINAHLVRYCEENHITFTRTRSYRKNDNCFVEQKNYSVVRRAVGYSRHDSQEELKVLNELYEYLGLYTNFFQPVMKLVSKERIGAKVRKTYDKPRTPYQRVLESGQVTTATKKQLTKTYRGLNPAQLKREITGLQNELINLVAAKEAIRLMGVQRTAAKALPRRGRAGSILHSRSR